MIKILSAAVVAAMVGGAALVSPASAEVVTVRVDQGHHHRVVEKRVVKRTVRHERCTTKKVVKFRHGKKIVSRVRTCR